MRLRGFTLDLECHLQRNDPLLTSRSHLPHTPTLCLRAAFDVDHDAETGCEVGNLTWVLTFSPGLPEAVIRHVH